MKIWSKNFLIPIHSELNYLEANGRQWIDTGYIPNYKMKLEFKTAVGNQNFRPFCGSYHGERDVYRIWSYKPTDFFQDYLGGNGTKGRTKGYYTMTVGQEYIIDCGNNYVNINGSSFLTGTTVAQGELQTTYSMWLFHQNTTDAASSADYGGYLRIYYFKIYEDNVLIKHFIPVLKNGIPCMYEKIEKKYYYNLGTRSFLYG